MGNNTGNNTTRQLTLYSFDDEECEYSLAETIKKAMMNDCPDARQEGLLAIKWNEPTILREKLEEMAASGVVKVSDLADDEEGGGEEDADDEEGKTDDATRMAREQTRMKNRADRAKRTAMVVKIQTKIRTLLARRALVQKKSEKTSFLCLALERAKCNLVDTVLEYQGAKPDSFQLDVSAAPPAHRCLPPLLATTAACRHPCLSRRK